MVRIILAAFWAFLMTDGTCFAQISGPTSVSLGSSANYTSSRPVPNTWILNDTIDYSSLAGTQTALASFSGTGSGAIAYDRGKWNYFASTLNADGTIYRMEFTDPEGAGVQKTVAAIPGSNHLAMDVVKDEATGKWYGFVVATNTLWRLDFGDSVTTTPTVSAPMNIADPKTISNPRQITVVKDDDGKWYAFVGNYLGVIGRLEFGTDITSTPVSTTSTMPNPSYSVGAVYGLGNYFALHRENGEWFILTTQVEILYRLDFGNSLANKPTEHFLTSSEFDNRFFRMISTGIISDCKNVVAYIVCGLGGPGVLRLNFGSSIKNPFKVEAMTGITSNDLNQAETALPYISNSGSVGFLINYWAVKSMRRFKVLTLPSGNVSNQPTFNPTFSTLGTNTIRLISNPLSPRGSHTECLSVNVVNAGLAAPDPFTDSSSNVCLGQQGVNYSIPPLAGAVSYEWSYSGTGATINGSGTSVTINFASNATNGQLSVRGIDASSNPGASRTMSIVVNNLPAASISHSGSGSFCDGTTYQLTANSGAGLSYQWTRNGSPVGSNTNTYAATAGGNYKVTVTNNTTGCSAASSELTLNLLAKPSATITPSGNVAFCANTPTALNASPVSLGSKYLWIGPSAVATDTNASFIPSQSGNYRVVVTGTNGCKDTAAQKQVTIHTVPSVAISPSGSNEICSGDNLQLQATGTGATSFTWFRNGTVIPSAAGNNYSTSSDGAYFVVGQDNNGCKDTSGTTDVAVLPIPQVTLTPADTAFCDNGYAVLTANTQDTGVAFEWYNGSGLIANASASFYQTGEADRYIVVVSRNGLSHCSASDTTDVTVYPIPQVSINWDGEVLTADPGFDQYEWFLNGQSLTTTTTNQYTPVFDGDYLVQVTDGNGCVGVSDTRTLEQVSIRSNVLADMVSIYPNPAHTVLHVSSPVPVRMAMTDMQGRTVAASEGEPVIMVQHLVPGIYFLNITDNHGVVIKKEKITIVRY